MHFRTVAKEIVYSTFSYNLQKTNSTTYPKTLNSKVFVLRVNIKLDLPHCYTYPRRKVLFGFKIRCDLHIVLDKWLVTKVSLHGVTCQLEVHLLQLPTLRAKHSLPQVRIVEMPCLSFTGTTAKDNKKGGVGHKKCQEDKDGYKLVKY